MGLIRSFRWLIKPTSLNIIPSSISVKKWTTYEIPYTVLPENATNQKVKWTSSNTNIATVSNWIITPVTAGTTTITGTTDYLWFTDTVNIEVYVVPATWVSLNESSITVDAWETFQLEATVTPVDTSYPEVVWFSSNTSVATVNSSGLVTYVGDGNATITVTTVYWWYTATCSVECVSAKPVSQTFTYTWADQIYTIPYTQCYKLEARWAWSLDAVWWYASWIMCMTKWTVLSIMVWQSGNSWWTYWFWWISNYSSSFNWAWLSWIFTGNTAITASDSSRALVIWGWAGSCSGRWNGWAGWWESWNSWWTSWYWTQGWWWTQSWHWSTWNAWSQQFCWWNGSWSYWGGWWWWWWWWNGTAWDGSAWDDRWAGWWSWYVLSTMTSRTLTTWWWASAWNHWCVKISSV